MFEFLKGYNTYLTAAGMALTASGAYFAGAISEAELVAALFAALQTVNIRKAISRK